MDQLLRTFEFFEGWTDKSKETSHQLLAYYNLSDDVKITLCRKRYRHCAAETTKTMFYPNRMFRKNTPCLTVSRSKGLDTGYEFKSRMVPLDLDFSS
jgi:hypothetical protein